MIKLKIEFMLRETGECVIYETTLKEKKSYDNFVCITNPVNGDEYVYVLGSTKIWRPKGNVLCAEQVELMSLKTEFEFA